MAPARLQLQTQLDETKHFARTKRYAIIFCVGRGKAGPLNSVMRLHIAYRFALRRSFVDAWRTGLLRANFAWLRNRAGGRPNSRLKARLKAGSDS